MCQDYVTEKFFENLNKNIVPIVMGKIVYEFSSILSSSIVYFILGDANYKTLAPFGSYIDINDYENPSQLAKYLKSLMKNPDEYAKYFHWKLEGKYKVIGNHGWVILLELNKERKAKCI